MKAQLFASTPDLDRHASLFGLGRSVVSAPSTQRARQDYYDFIDGLIHRLHPELPSSAESPAAVTEIVLGHYACRPRSQSQRLRRRPHGQSCGRHALDTTVPAPAGIQDPDPADNLPWDGKLRAIYPTYCAVRRRIWRTRVAEHQSCTFSAAAKLWWDVEGEHVAAFCPTAAAFLRWRMFWEGVRVPADLFRRPRHPPFGILGWLCDGAPIGAEQWTPKGEQWLAHRVFAMDCIRNFHEWQVLCASAVGAKATQWSRSAAGGYCLTYWAATGNDNPSAPLRVILDGEPKYECTPSGSESSAQHRQWHASQLRKIVR
jgi:hypothetical protein